jgi:hypothetical protein
VHCTLLHAGTGTRSHGGSPPSKSASTFLGCPFGLGPENSFLPKGLRQRGDCPTTDVRNGRLRLDQTGKGANILGILAALIGVDGGYPMRASSDRRGIWIGSLPAMASIEPVTSEPSLLVDLPHTATTSALAAGIPQ